jgi:hypothetical protein
MQFTQGLKEKHLQKFQLQKRFSEKRTNVYC